MPGRDNGFVARHYVPLADLDPRLADAMLEALRAEGIAAYVVPSTGQLGGYLEVHLPERPRDRLWVDRRHHDRATTLLNVHGDRPDLLAAPSSPGQHDGNKADVEGAPDVHPDDHVDGAPYGGDSADDVWAQIVAGFDLPTTVGAGPWPLAEDCHPTPTRRLRAAPTARAWTAVDRHRSRTSTQARRSRATSHRCRAGSCGRSIPASMPRRRAPAR